MRYVVVVGVLVAACHRSPVRADPPLAQSSATASVSVSAPALTASAPPAAPAKLGLVASVPHPTLRLLGDHVSVSSGTFHASADGDAPLVLGDELMKGLAYTPGAYTLWLAGTWPDVFAFRRDDRGEPCGAIDHPTFFAHTGGAWKSFPLARDPIPPIGAIGWSGGMLLVDAMAAPCGWATSSPLESFTKGPGTTFTLVGADGKATHPTLDLDPTFITLGVSYAGDAIALSGTFGDTKSAMRDVVVMRGRGRGPFRPTVIVRGTGWHAESWRTRVREFGVAAIVLPPPAHDDGSVLPEHAEGGDEITYKGHASSIFVVTDAAVSERAFRGPTEQDCTAEDAVYFRGDVYAIVACPKKRTRLERLTEAGAREPIALSCAPTSLEARAQSDLWIAASCGVFRLGHPQAALHAVH